MKPKLIIFLFFLLLLSSFAYAKSDTLYFNSQSEYNTKGTGVYKIVRQEGTESIFKISQTKTHIDEKEYITICAYSDDIVQAINDYNTGLLSIDPKSETIKDIPTKLSYQSGKGLLSQSGELSLIKEDIIEKEYDIISDKYIDIKTGEKHKFCANVNPETVFYLKLGEDSIELEQLLNYSTQTVLINMTSENSFAHATINNNNLLAYYPFDVNYQDYTNNNFDGTLIGSLSEVDGVFGKAIYSNGGLNGVDITDSKLNFSDTQQATYSAWVDLDAFTLTSNYGSCIICQDYTLYNTPLATMDGLSFMITYNGFLSAQAYLINETNSTHRKAMTVASSIADILTTDYRFVSAVFDETKSEDNICIYIDGSLLSCGNITEGFNFNYDSGGYTYIGLNPTDGGISSTQRFNGSIDEVMIFNTALNSSQILEIYNNQSKRFKNNPTFEPKFENFTANEYDRINITADCSNFRNTSCEWKAKWITSNISHANLVSYFPLDNHTFDVVTGLGLNPNNTTSTSNAIFKQGYRLDGSNVIEGTIPDSVKFQRDEIFTIAGWYNQSTASGDIISTRGITPSFSGWQLTMSGNTPRFYLATGGSPKYAIQWNETTTYNTWNHVAVTYNGNESVYGFEVYLNGQKKSYSILDNDCGSPISYNSIYHSYRLGVDFNGTLDDFMVFNNNLSESDISSLYNNRVSFIGDTNYNESSDYVTLTEEINISGNPNWVSSSIRLNCDSYGYLCPYISGNITYGIWKADAPPKINLTINKSIIVKYNDSIKINCSIIDDYGLNNTNITLYYPNGSILYQNNSYNYSEYILNYKDELVELGYYNVSCYAMDTINQTSYESVLFQVVDSPPITFIIIEPTGWYAQDHVPIVLNYTTNHTVTWNYTLDSNSPITFIYPNNLYTYRLLNITNGEHNLTITSINEDGVTYEQSTSFTYIYIERDTEMASLSITLFILLITGVIFYLGIRKQSLLKNEIANIIVKRIFIAFALWLMVLNTSIIATISETAELGVVQELFTYLWLFGWAGYVAIVVVFFLTLVNIIGLWSTKKYNKSRGIFK